MFKNISSALFLSLWLAIGLTGAELRPFPWSEGLNDPAHFRPHSSGECRISADGEGVVKIQAEFPPGVDRWCYPKLIFQKPVENFEDAEELRFEVKFDPDPKGFRYAYLMLDGHPNYPLPRPDGSWQKVVVNFKAAKIDPAKVTMVEIGANPGSDKLTYRLRNLEVLSSKPWTPAAFDAADAIVIDAPGTLFLDSETPTFRLRGGVDRPAAYLLRDWKGAELRRGDWPDAGKGKLQFPGLPRGYYTLELSGRDGISFTGTRSFAVVSDPAARTRNPESFFALDSAQSWLARADNRNIRFPTDAFQLVSDVAYRSGAAMVRERMHWSETEPRPGVFQWRQYKTNADLLQARNIPVLGMYHNAPAWAKPQDAVAALPVDLLALHDFAREQAREFQGQMTVWEFWNEPDIYYTIEGAWDYASALKAAYLGYKAGDPQLPVALGGIAKTRLTPYNETLMANAAGEYFDIYSIHFYDPLVDYPELCRNLFAFLKRYNLDTRTAWVTENGCRAEGAGELDSYISGLKQHSPEQELLVAEFLPKAMIQLQFNGFDRDFFFVLPPYGEQGGTKVWGLMRLDYTAKPALIAFSNLAANLENATLEGAIDLGDPALCAYLYRQGDGSQTLVYWTKSELDTEPLSDNLKRSDEKVRQFSLPVSGTRYSGCDIFGTPFELDAANGVLAVTSTRMPAFLNGLSGLRPTRSPLRSAERQNADRSDFNRAIVFQTQLSNDFTLSLDRESADICREDVFLKLTAWNLSAQEQSGSIAISGGKVIGLPAECAIPAFSKVEYLLKFTPDIDEERRGEFRVNGHFNQQPVTSLLIPLTCYNNLDHPARVQEFPEMLKPSNWRENSSGTMEISFDPEENAIAFAAKFTPADHDRWFYPEYLLHLPQESLENAIGISFEVKAVPPYGIRQMLVMATPGVERETGEAYFLKASSPSDEWETRTVSFGQQKFDPATIRMLRFGMNTTRDEISFLLRNVKILYGK